MKVENFVSYESQPGCSCFGLYFITENNFPTVRIVWIIGMVAKKMQILAFHFFRISSTKNPYSSLSILDSLFCGSSKEWNER